MLRGVPWGGPLLQNGLVKTLPVVDSIEGYGIAKSNVSRQSVFPKNCLDRSIVVVVTSDRLV
jgi:hypothetical protein